MIYRVLYNPLAGSHTAGAPADSRLPLKAEDSAVSYDITAVTDYKAFFASIDPSDTVVISGGDGTLNRFINDTEGLAIPNPLCYLSGGTGNDFLRDLNRRAEDGILSLTPYLQDLPEVEINGRRYRFLNNVGFGIDGYCCEVGDTQRAARKEGDHTPINYTAIAIKGLLFHYKPTTATVTVDGVTHTFRKAWLAPTMKGRCYGGGMFAAPAQDRLDPEGRLSVMVFHGKGRLRTLIAFPSIFKGEHIKHKSMVKILEGRDIRVAFDSPRTVQIDGETVTGVTEYHAYTVQAAPKTEETTAAAHV
jgi:diacylglycerol kinase family enzyme